LGLEPVNFSWRAYTLRRRGRPTHPIWHCFLSSNLVTTTEAILADAEANVVAAYLFGSVARGEDRESSDIDITVLLREKPSGSLMGLPFTLEGRLERALGKTVQVIVLNGAAPDLVHRVLRDGVPLLDRDRSFRISFEVYARNQFFDILPTLRMYRRHTLEGAAE